MDTLNDWVWEMDLNGIHTYTNKAVTRCLGYEPEEILGQHVTIIWPDDSTTTEKVEQFNCELKDGLDWNNFRGRFKHKDGSIRIMDRTGVPIHDESGKLIGFRVVDRDVTDQVRREQELQESEERYRVLSNELAEADHFKTLLLDIITHDLINPAAVIKGFTELMLEDKPDVEHLEMIYTSINQLLNVLEEASTLARMSVGDQIEFSELDLSTILNKIVRDLKPLADQSGVDISLSIPYKCMILANPIVSEVFRNYIENAIKHSRIGNRVVIKIRPLAREVECTVTDFGVTIPRDQHSRIFYRRTQLKNNAVLGKGLGSAIVKRIARAHNVEFGIRENKPTGNIFYFRLPVKIG